MIKFIILASIALIVVAIIYHYAGRVRAAENPERHLAPLDDTRGAILEAQVTAALAGHDIGPFDEVGNGYQAACRRCGNTVWVGESGLLYSLLGEACGG